MRLARYRLVKLETDDRLVRFHHAVALDKVYTVDLDSIEERTMYNVLHGKRHTKRIVWTVGGDNDQRWLPLECLELVTNE